MPVGDENGVESVANFERAYELAREFMRKQKMEEDVYYQRQTMFEITLQIKKFKQTYKPKQKVTLKLI